MQINVSFDSSASAAPSWYATAVNAAVGQMEALIATPITLNLVFAWGEENGNAIKAGTAAQNQSYGSARDYTTLYNALSSHATSADDHAAVAALTPSNPTGTGTFYLPTALQKALGLMDANASGTDGYVGLDASLKWATNIGGAPAAGQYDPIPTIEHEITEIMGRVGYLSDAQHPNQYGPMDLFRYTAPGQRALTAGPASFSVDGKTMGMPLNNPASGGDAADWAASVIGDTFGNTTAGIGSTLSAADVQLLDVLGYTIGSVPTNNAVSAAPVAAATPAPPNLGFDDGATFTGPRRATFTGHVSDPAALVELFRGDTDLGAASVEADGTWSLTATLAGAGNGAITATATDGAGRSADAAADFTITTGIQGKPYATREDKLDAAGSVSASVFVRQSGAVHARARAGGSGTGSPTNQSLSDAYADAASLLAGDPASAATGEAATFVAGTPHQDAADLLTGGGPTDPHVAVTGHGVRPHGVHHGA